MLPHILAQSSSGGVSLLGAAYPVQKVTWYDVIRFANKLSEQEGLEACYSIRNSKIVLL